MALRERCEQLVQENGSSDPAKVCPMKKRRRNPVFFDHGIQKYTAQLRFDDDTHFRPMCIQWSRVREQLIRR